MYFFLAPDYVLLLSPNHTSWFLLVTLHAFLLTTSSTSFKWAVVAFNVVPSGIISIFLGFRLHSLTISSISVTSPSEVTTNLNHEFCIALIAFKVSGLYLRFFKFPLFSSLGEQFI